MCGSVRTRYLFTQPNNLAKADCPPGQESQYAEQITALLEGQRALATTLADIQADIDAQVEQTIRVASDSASRNFTFFLDANYLIAYQSLSFVHELGHWAYQEIYKDITDSYLSMLDQVGVSSLWFPVSFSAASSIRPNAASFTERQLEICCGVSRLYVEEVERLLKKWHWTALFSGSPADDLRKSLYRQRRRLMRRLFKKAADRTARWLEAYIQNWAKPIDWVLTSTAGKQTHKRYYKLSPHRSIHAPEEANLCA